MAQQPGRDDPSPLVWVYGEHRKGRFLPVVFELIGRGAELAEALGGRLEVVATGAEVDGLAAQLAGLPVRTLHLAAHPALAEPREGPEGRALAHLAAACRPEVLIAGATGRGRSLMPRLAAVCGTGLTADCTGLEIDPEGGHLVQTRPAFGGNVMARIVCRRHRPQMATVRPKVMHAPERQGSAEPPVRRWAMPDDLMDDPVRVLTRGGTEAPAVNIAEADVLVAGGRGIGGPAGFELLRRLADALGGEVAASRPAVEAGWAPYERQVGQTGKTVQPRLYVAVGISGSVQHRAGMQSAGTIVAVNSDRAAPIFQVADYGIVGDYRQVVPRLIEELQREAGR